MKQSYEREPNKLESENLICSSCVSLWLCVCLSVCAASWQRGNRDLWRMIGTPCIKCHLIFLSSTVLVILFSSIPPYRFSIYSPFIYFHFSFVPSSYLSFLCTFTLSFLSIRVFVREQVVDLCQWWDTWRPAQQLQIKLVGCALTLRFMLWSFMCH